MKTETLTSTEVFTPIKLYVDQNQVDRILNQYHEWAGEANKTLDEVAAAIERKLTADEVTLLLEQGWAGFEAMMRNAHPGFPKAAFSTLRALHGIKADHLEHPLTTMARRAQAAGLIAHYGKVKVDEAVVEKTIEEATAYTRSEEGNRALELAQRLAKSLQEAEKEGWMSTMDRNTI